MSVSTQFLKCKKLTRHNIILYQSNQTLVQEFSFKRHLTAQYYWEILTPFENTADGHQYITVEFVLRCLTLFSMINIFSTGGGDIYIYAYIVYANVDVVYASFSSCYKINKCKSEQNSCQQQQCIQNLSIPFVHKTVVNTDGLNNCNFRFKRIQF